jgi:iron complex outermembrane receptor protein
MARVGFLRRLVKTGLKLAFPLALSIGWGTQAQAQCRKIQLAAGTLGDALLSLARQTGTDIATSESGTDTVLVKPVSGCLNVSRALERLTRGSGYRAVAVGKGGYRIVKAPVRPSLVTPAKTQTVATGELPDIIVTGTKQKVALLRFPGSVHIVDGKDFALGIGRAATLDDLASMSPIMQKTELGIGRNKLFIRGISDSSFNGPTQSTATVYFGEVQLNYSGPEPAIHLADMERVEILEGPQETLYGAGAISGIIRLVPRPVELDRIAAWGSAGGTFTKTGAPGYDVNAMLNLPIARDEIGVRFVAYRMRDGGYIDDSLRKTSNVNRTDTFGGRVTLRIEPGEGWSFEGGVLSQKIEADDAGYTETIAGPQTRRAFLPQPYSSTITLWRAVLRKDWESGLEMVSATGMVRTEGSDTFDATRLFPFFGPTVYQVDSNGLQLSQETRLSRTTDNGISWIGGVVLLYDRDAQRRVIGPATSPFEIIGVANTTRSASVFGEMTFPITSTFSVTAGARGTIAQTQGEPTQTPTAEPSERGNLLKRVQPAIAVSWLFAPRLAAFARFQTGYRTGGIAVARGIGRIANFQPDSIKVGEIGVRRERSGPRGLSFSSALSIARWEAIQADLFSRFAQPYTSNIGDATILAVEAEGDWIPYKGLRASFALLWTENRTSGELAGTSVVQNRHLPDTPPFSGNARLEYQWSHMGGARVWAGGFGALCRPLRARHGELPRPQPGRLCHLFGGCDLALAKIRGQHQHRQYRRRQFQPLRHGQSAYLRLSRADRPVAAAQYAPRAGDALVKPKCRLQVVKPALAAKLPETGEGSADERGFQRFDCREQCEPPRISGCCRTWHGGGVGRTRQCVGGCGNRPGGRRAPSGFPRQARCIWRRSTRHQHPRRDRPL